MLSSIARHIIYPLHEAVLKRPTIEYLKQLEQSQWLPRDEIELIQQKKLSSLLEVALEHCPWHAVRLREAGIEPADIQLGDLRLLPTMDKDDAAAYGQDMRWDGVPGGSFKYSTGGSSGSPLVFQYGRMRQASDAAGRIRARRWWGVNFGDPEVYLWGAPVELQKTDRIKTVRDRLLNQMVLNAFEMSASSMAEYLQAILAFRPSCIYGYASSIALLAAFARDTGVAMAIPELKVICTTGEAVYDHQRKLIKEVFGVPVANEFGSRDIGFTAHEAPGGEMLQLSESQIVEVLDATGEPVAPGELGEAVITGLCSVAQPFIRYRTGDMVRACEELPSGGRGLHKLGEVVGRKTDFLVRSDGTIMHALAIIYVLREIAGVSEFKVIQHSIHEIEVNVVKNCQWRDMDEPRIVDGIKARMGEDAQVILSYPDNIAVEPSGKFRHVVSRVELPGHLKDCHI